MAEEQVRSLEDEKSKMWAFFEKKYTQLKLKEGKEQGEGR